jgi:hypothetical protein
VTSLPHTRPALLPASTSSILSGTSWPQTHSRSIRALQASFLIPFVVAISIIVNCRMAAAVSIQFCSCPPFELYPANSKTHEHYLTSFAVKSHQRRKRAKSRGS